MTRDDLKQLIAEVQRRQSELDNVEVKTARGGTPKRLYEALSAFANRRERAALWAERVSGFLYRRGR
jgi:hypothetical protein